MAAEERWMGNAASQSPNPHPSLPGTSTLGIIFSHCLVLGYFGREVVHPISADPSSFISPAFGNLCSPDAHLHSITHWLGKGPQDTQAGMEAGQTHQLFEEGSFLVLL